MLRLSTVWTLLALFGLSVHAAELSPSEALLTQHGIAVTTESIRAWLNDLHPDGKQKNRIIELIGQLSDEDFVKREAAMLTLLKMPIVSPELLQDAIDSDDPEKRWRARKLLKGQTERGRQLLLAVLRVIGDKSLKGLAPEVLAAMPLCDGKYPRQLANRALQATAVEADVALLRSLLKSPWALERAAAGMTLARLIHDSAIGDLRPLLRDSDERVQSMAAKVLADFGQRESLPKLIELLSSDELEIRMGSIRVLRAITGQRFGFVAYDDQQRREKPTRSWQVWLKTTGRTARLRFPIPDTEIIHGRTLICDRTRNLLFELDATGRQVWAVPVTRPYGCHALPNGHRLVASYSGRFVAEFDETGKEIWRADNLPTSPYSVQRLENGNTLVACYTSRKVIEIRPDKSIAWQITLKGKPKDARRLENGNTLIAVYSPGVVLEVNSKGEIVRRLAAGTGTYSAQRLPNGNTLICHYTAAKVVEYDREGRTVWTQAGQKRMYDAQRLPNGNTLYVDSIGVHEVDPEGNRIWTHNAAGARRAIRF